MSTKEVVFHSRHPKHEILRFPKVEAPTAMGQWVTQNQGLTYKFEQGLDRETGALIGVLRVREGQDVSDMDHNGTLRQGEPTGVPRDAVQFLMAHRVFGEEVWLLGHAPGTKYPRPVDMRRDLRMAGIALDEEKVAELLETEQATHQRPDLLQEAQETLDAIREAKEQLMAQPAEDFQTPTVTPVQAKPKAKAKPQAGS